MENTNDLTTIPYWFDEPASCFESVRSKVSVTTTIGRWLKSIIEPTTESELNRLKDINTYRKTGDKKLKLKIPAFCPGALMHSRDASLPTAERIERLTGWMQFDIDSQDNPHIDSAEKLRDALANITYTAFCSISTSGKGVWGLIKVSDVKNYKAHFEQLKLDYKSLGITLDATKGGNPTDLRYYTFDPSAYISDELRVYDRLIKPSKDVKKPAFKPHKTTDNWDKVSEVVQEINSNNIDIAPDYDTYVKLGFSLANEFGEPGRDLFHSACQPSSKYSRKDADAQYTACLRAGGSGITLGTFFHLVKSAD